MQGDPISLVSETFGSTVSGSIWTIIITAALTAFATFWSGYILEVRKRDLDRLALAASILAEVEAILRLFTQLRIEERYWAVQAEMKKKLEASEKWTAIPSDALTFPVTIYEKCADRIGTLGAETAADVVHFYNYLNGFRANVRMAMGASDLPLANRLASVNFLLDTLSTEKVKAEALRRKLRGIVSRKLFV